MAGYFMMSALTPDEIRQETASMTPAQTTTHELKTVPPWFAMIYHGEKTAELRVHDRAYCKHDRLRLREYVPGEERYTGREILAEIISVLTDADGPWLAPDHCMLSFRILEVKP